MSAFKRIYGFCVLMASVGAIDGFVFAIREVARHEYLRQGLWRTSLWVTADCAVSGAALGAAGGALIALLASYSPVVVSALRKLIEAPAAQRPVGGTPGTPMWLSLAPFFGLCSGVAMLFIPTVTPTRLGVAYVPLVAASFAAAWLAVSSVAAAARSPMPQEEQSRLWFRVRWLTLVALVYVVLFLHVWVTVYSEVAAVKLLVRNLVLCALAYVILYRPARWLDEAVGRRLGRVRGARPAQWLPLGILAAAVGLYAAGWIVGMQARADARQRGRNVIIIVVDTVRSDRVSLVSETERDRDLTPNLRQLLAARGTVFTRAISQAPWTTPAVASIFTGLYPEQHSMEHLTNKLPAERLTLAELMREAGYRTMAVVSHDFVGPRFQMAQGFGVFDDSQAPGLTTVTSGEVTARALRMLRANHRDPFFLFLHYFDPHYDYKDHPAFEFADDYAGWLYDEARLDHSIEILRTKRHLLNDAEYTYLRDLYDEEIAYTDEEIGRLLRFLDEARLWDSTLIVFVADHGEEFGERGWIGHTLTLHDELIRVPLALAAPSGERPPTVDHLVETRWLFGTVLDFLGLPDRTGQASCPSLLGDPSDAESLVRSSTRPVSRLGDHGTLAGKHVWLSCVVAERWKLIKDHVTGRLTLFDLSSDPAEIQDRAADRRAVTGELERRLDDWESELSGGAPAGPPPRVDPEQLRQLESLGYL